MGESPEDSLLAEEGPRTAVKSAAIARPPLVDSPFNLRRFFVQSQDRTTRTADVATARTVQRLSRKNAKAFAVAATVLLLALGLAAFVWRRRDLFHEKQEASESLKYCPLINTGSAAACGSPWSAPCFDRSRCRPGGGDAMRDGGGGDVLSVYVHDETCSMRSSSDIMTGYHDGGIRMLEKTARVLRQIADARGLLVETPYEACIVFYVVPSKGECVSQTPTWGEGQNHVVVDLRDQTREHRPQLNVKAMFAQSNMRTCYYRHGFDIAVPLRASMLYNKLRNVAPRDRKYFATFKGSLYLTGNGLLERGAVLDINRGGTARADSSNHTSSDVVVAEHCQETNGKQRLPENKAKCEAYKKEYDKVNYTDLMNTTFALLPSGRSPATYRLGEALSAGAIPVFILQDFVKPFPEKIPWSEFSFSFPPHEAPRILETLRAVSDKELAQMQVTALKVFDAFFGPGMDDIVRIILDIFEDRLSFRD